MDKPVPVAEFIGYIGCEIGRPTALYNVGEDTWTAETLVRLGIEVPETPTSEEWEIEKKQLRDING